MGKTSLVVYVIAVVIVWAIILSVLWFTGNRPLFNKLSIFGMGFMIGMLAMWIAVHLYKWK